MVRAAAAGVMLHRVDNIVRRQKKARRAEMLRHEPFGLVRIDHDDLRSAAQACALNDRQANTATSEDHDRLARLNSGRKHRGANPGCESAANETRTIEWHVVA